MLKFVVLSLLVAVACAGKVKFIDCGNKEGIEVDVSNCSGDYCKIQKNKNLEISGTFTANQDTSKVTVELIAEINGVEIKVPGVDTNGCHMLKCPVKKGTVVPFKFDWVVPTILPNSKGSITAKFSGEHGVLVCGKVMGEVTN